MNIKEALKQGSCEKGGTNFSYIKLGLSDDVFERVASSVETFIKDENALKAWVSSPSTLELLQSYQSNADKIRTELNAKITTIEGEKAALEAKLKEITPTPPTQNKPDVVTTAQTVDPSKPTLDNLSELIAKQVSEAISPLMTKLNEFETGQNQKNAVAALDTFKSTWDYAKGYPSESEDAYERVVELYEAGGKKWTGEELTSKFKEKLNKSLLKRGIDTAKPYQSEPPTDTKPDFSGEIELLKDAGVTFPD